MRMLLILFFGLAAIAAFCEELEVDKIIQRSVEANEADWKAAPQYDCFVTEQEDKGTPKTFKEMMILGSPYRVLMGIDGKPLSPAEPKKQEQRLQEVIAQRKNESQQERERRIAKYEREQQRNRLLMDQLTSAFKFKLLGQQELNSRDVYVINATPRPGYHPPNLKAEVLTGMQGKLWIDAREFQWVKVEAEAFRPVNIEGFLARVEPGTRFELEKAPVSPGVWLVKHFAMKARAKILLLFNKRNQEEETYFNCHHRASELPAEVSTTK